MLGDAAIEAVPYRVLPFASDPNTLNPEPDPDSGCCWIRTRIQTSAADPDTGSGAFLGSDMEKSRIRDEHPASYFREHRNNFLD